MAGVPLEIFQTATASIEARILNTESRLNELFGTVDSEIQEHSNTGHQHLAKINEILQHLQSFQHRVTKGEEEVAGIKVEVPQRLQLILDQSQEHMNVRSKSMEESWKNAQEAFQGIQNQVVALQRDVVHLGSVTSAGGGGAGRKRSMLDLKNFNVKNLDGDKETKIELDDWREDMEDYMNSSMPHLKQVMEKASRWKEEIDEGEFHKILTSIGINLHQLTWQFDDLQDEPYSFMKKRTLGRARKAFTTATLGFLDAYRRMIVELDPVNARTKGVMMEAITGMVTRGRAKKPR